VLAVLLGLNERRYTAGQTGCRQKLTLPLKRSVSDRDVLVRWFPARSVKLFGEAEKGEVRREGFHVRRNCRGAR